MPDYPRLSPSTIRYTQDPNGYKAFEFLFQKDPLHIFHHNHALPIWPPFYRSKEILRRCHSICYVLISQCYIMYFSSICFKFFRKIQKTLTFIQLSASSESLTLRLFLLYTDNNNNLIVCVTLLEDSNNDENRNHNYS